ncbi:MAG TPA: hypothetical protein VIV60_28645, partial [Polyangiaceae bacterium]
WQRRTSRSRRNGRIRRIGSGIAIGVVVVCAALLLFARFGTTELTTNGSVVAPSERAVVESKAAAPPVSDAIARASSDIALVAAAQAPSISPSTTSPSSNAALPSSAPNKKGSRELQAKLPSVSAKSVTGVSTVNLTESRLRPPLDASKRSSAPRDLFAGPQ